ncbi:hypothetical protein HmCmsJML010_03135 [Escherichia coli]|uniref:hypothetical protein n=1 Tax=Escherichia coli TaxID=562 RepID=UPI0010C3B391|nr:hypothetical protein [Escherichia coli]MEB6543939.1 hypothetical protein [Escherichia coli]GCS76532.1 hypothetical protein HmCmsJML010_03135 [Escherichia coli]
MIASTKSVYDEKKHHWGWDVEKFYVGYNDVCQAVGRATLNLISHGDAPTTEAIISMLESLGDIEQNDFWRQVFRFAAEEVRKG